MHRGVVFAPRSPPKVPRVHIELTCCALVYVLGKAPQAKGFLGALCEPRTAPRAVARREAPRPQIRTKTGLGHDLRSPLCTLEKAPFLTGFIAPLRKSI